MKALVLLLAVSGPAIACDWEVSKRTDSMTDATICTVSSAQAKIAFYRHGTDRPNVIATSAYPRPYITIRVDDNEAVRMGRDGWARTRALDALLPQLETGQRIRVRVQDYPEWMEGDALICDLPELLSSC